MPDIMQLSSKLIFASKQTTLLSLVKISGFISTRLASVLKKHFIN